MEDVAEKFEIKTTAQVERTYIVEASDDAQAKKRLRTFIADADALRAGVVQPLAAVVNTTPERIKGIEPYNGQPETVPPSGEPGPAEE